MNSSLLARNIILLGYNNTRLERHKTFSPFHDVITEFDCTSFTYITQTHTRARARALPHPDSSISLHKLNTSKVQITLEHVMKTRGGGGEEVQLYSFFNLGVRWRWVDNARPRPLYPPPPRERQPVPIVQEAGWAPRTGLDGCGKFRPHQDSITGPSSPYRVAIPTALLTTLTQSKLFIIIQKIYHECRVSNRSTSQSKQVTGPKVSWFHYKNTFVAGI
jgi:hypothetical protein